jgi:hypothetical protein
LRGVDGIAYVSAQGDDSLDYSAESSPWATVARALSEPNKIGGSLVLLGVAGPLTGLGNTNLTFSSMSVSVSSTTGAVVDCEGVAGRHGWALTRGAYWLTGVTFRACDQGARSRSAYTVYRGCRFERNERRYGNGSALQIDGASAEAIDCVFADNANTDG